MIFAFEHHIILKYVVGFLRSTNGTLTLHISNSVSFFFLFSRSFIFFLGHNFLPFYSSSSSILLTLSLICCRISCYYYILTYDYIFLPFLLLMAFAVRVIWFLDASSYKIHMLFFLHNRFPHAFSSDFIYPHTFAFNRDRMFTFNELKLYGG